MIYDEERNCYTLTKLEENCIKLHIENESLQKKLDLALDTLGQIAKFSTDSTDAVQCGVTIQQINEMDEVL